MHTFKKGSKVTVINRTMSGKFYVEGRAEIVSRINDSDEYYKVRFERRLDTLERFVDPQAQDDCAAFVEQLNAPRAAHG